MDEINIKMKELVQKYGLEILSEEKRLNALLADFFPKERKLRKAIRDALDVGVGRMFFELAKSTGKDSTERLATIRKKLVDGAWISEAAADSVCRIFVTAIGREELLSGTIGREELPLEIKGRKELLSEAKSVQESKETKSHDSVTALKNSFAQAAYERETDYGSLYRLALNWMDDEKKKNVLSVSNQIDNMVKSGGNVATVEQMSVIYAALVKKLAEEEKEDYHRILNQCVLPGYARIKEDLSLIVRKSSNIYSLVSAKLEQLTDIEFPVELVNPPVPFYWEVSPIPPQNMTKGRISYFVSNAVAQSFSIYYDARIGRMEDVMRFLKDTEETRISDLVTDFFLKLKNY